MRRTHFSLFIVVLLLLLCLVWMYGDETNTQDSAPEDHTYLQEVRFQAEGKTFTGVLGAKYSPAYFSMRDDKFGIQLYLRRVQTPFSVSKGGEEISFHFNVNHANEHEFFYAIGFPDESLRKVVNKMAGWCSYIKEYSDYGVPAAFNIIIKKEGEIKPILDQIEDKTCFIGGGYGSEGSVYKRISSINLTPGDYQVTIINMYAVNEFDGFNIYVGISSHE